MTKPYMPSLDMDYKPLIIAHRGARSEAPDNLRSSFDLALTYPIDGIELDVQLSLDSVPVLYHDRTVYKINRRLKHISDYHYAELMEYDCGGWHSEKYCGEPILSLSRALTLYSSRTRMLIEIKSRKRDRLVKRSELLTSLTMKLIAEKVSNETLSNIFILSFDPEVLRLGYKQTPALKYVLNLERPEELSNNKSETDHLHAFCMPVSRLRESFVKKARAGGKQIWTYSCNVPSQVRKALSFRADLIMTDRPGWLPQYLNITDPRK